MDANELETKEPDCASQSTIIGLMVGAVLLFAVFLLQESQHKASTHAMSALSQHMSLD